MKEKIKRYTKEFIDYTLTDEFKLIVITLLSVITIAAVLFGVIAGGITEKSIETLQEQQEKYEKLEKDYNNLQLDYNRLNMWNDELYELFYSCQNESSWYEDFYYDNVSPSGEIEGEYYE